MRILSSFQGRRGEIVIVEDRETSGIGYFEDGVFQSHARSDGTSLFAYVQLMVRLLRPAKNILVLGCAAGSLATMLSRQGKSVTLVDDNPLCFPIAREFFGLPADVTCFCGDFHDFLASDRTRYDGIGIDVGAFDISFDAEFDPYTCRQVRDHLGPHGRIVMNIVAKSDIDTVPDRILAKLAATDLNGWIFDEPGIPNRNAILAAVPERRPCLGLKPLCEDDYIEPRDWKLRRQRLHLSALPYAHRIIAPQKAI
jgi:spermidine synthase